LHIDLALAPSVGMCTPTIQTGSAASC